MADKCKKKTSTIEVCNDLQMALMYQMMHKQVLRNFTTGQRRERIVLQSKAGDLPIQYCPFCRINIAIPSNSPDRPE